MACLPNAFLVLCTHHLISTLQGLYKAKPLIIPILQIRRQSK